MFRDSDECHEITKNRIACKYSFLEFSLRKLIYIWYCICNMLEQIEDNNVPSKNVGEVYT